MTGLEAIAGWPLVVSMAATVTAQTLRAGRRRDVLNEALHELRRPLQVAALSSGPLGTTAAVEDPIDLAALALERLDREINGGKPVKVWGSFECRPVVRAAVGRWQARAAAVDAGIEIRWNAGRATVHGDRFALAQALDNLIVNAIEHGGPSIVVSARLRAGNLRLAVADSGRAARWHSRRKSAAEALARLSGRRRRGHGLPVVRRVAAAHGGRFALRRSEHGSLAVLELPLGPDQEQVA